MRKLVEVTEVSGEGFEALLGETVTIFCTSYIYTGKLVGINSTYIKLDNPSIVYETGELTSKNWKDAQKLPNSIYVLINQMESFGVVK